MITVDDLFKTIAEITVKNDQWHTIDRRIEYYKKCIDFYGDENKHLKNIYNDCETQYYPVDRQEDNYLIGNEPVYGSVLLFYYCGHDGFGYVKNFENKEELEKFVYKFGEPSSDFYYIEEISIFIDESGKIETKVYLNG